MEMLYTIGFFKLCGQSNNMKHVIRDVSLNGELVNVIFCENEKGAFVVAGKYRKTAPHRSCGRWHSGDSYYDIFFRKNFIGRDEGNRFYKEVKATKEIRC